MLDFNYLKTIAIDQELRPYQQDLKIKLYEGLSQQNAIMLQMPTGTGKTRIFTSITKDIHKFSLAKKHAYKVLLLAHRVELIQQISQNVGVNYKIAHGIIKSGQPVQLEYPTQVASVQTLFRRLIHYPKLDFDLIIIDEAHHAIANSYVKICERFPKAKIIGVTATPYRLNGSGFSDMFDTLILSPSVDEFIKMKFLSDYEYYSIKPDSETQKLINGINKFNIDGDYAESELEIRLNVDKIRAKVLDNYLKYAQGKKGIVYTINRKHNQMLCDAFKEAGIIADAIDSNTNEEERADIIKDFKNGKILVLFNVNIFTEGFDCPDVEFIQLARPTLSLGLYLQQVGRGLRIHENKEIVTIIDNVGLYNRFGMPSSNRKWKYHFNGHQINEELTENTKTVKWVEDKNIPFISEGDEKIELIYKTNSITIQNNSSSSDNTDFDNIYYYPICNIQYTNSDNISESSDIQFSDTIWQEKVINHILECRDQKYHNRNKLSLSTFKLAKKSEFFIKSKLLHTKTEPNSLNLNFDRYKLVEKDGLFGIWDTLENKIALEIGYNSINYIDKANRILVKRGEKFGIVSANTWSFDISCDLYDNIQLVGKDHAIVKKRGFYGVVWKGNLTLPIIYNNIIVQLDILTTLKEENIAFFDHNLNEINFKPQNQDLLFSRIYKVAYKNHYVLTNEKGQILYPNLFSDISKSKYGNDLIICKSASNEQAGYYLLDSKCKLITDVCYDTIIELNKKYYLVDFKIINIKGEIDPDYYAIRHQTMNEYCLISVSDGTYIKYKIEFDGTFLIYKDDISTTESFKEPRKRIENLFVDMVYRGYKINYKKGKWVAIHEKYNDVVFSSRKQADLFSFIEKKSNLIKDSKNKPSLNHKKDKRERVIISKSSTDRQTKHPSQSIKARNESYKQNLIFDQTTCKRTSMFLPGNVIFIRGSYSFKTVSGEIYPVLKKDSFTQINNIGPNNRLGQIIIRKGRKYILV